MSKFIEQQQSDFDGWVEKWEAAQEKGIFDKPKTPPSTGDNKSDASFFGLRSDYQSDSINPTSAEYWRAINAVADGGIEFETLNEEEEKSINANPIRRETEGKDQALEDYALGLTFTPKALDELAEMKKKLYTLESMAARMEDKDYSLQIKEIVQKIDNLSDKLGTVRK